MKNCIIIKKETEADFRAAIGDRMSKISQLEFVFQVLHNLPEALSVPAWTCGNMGNGHAFMRKKKKNRFNVIDGPFALLMRMIIMDVLHLRWHMISLQRIRIRRHLSVHDGRLQA